MRIEQLEYFHATARRNSMSRAAEELHLTPQAMSMSIKALEQELGVELFEKKSTGVFLTDRGKEIMFLVEDILDKVDRIKTLCTHESTHKQLAGNISVLSTPIIGSYYVGKTIVDFKKDYPQVHVALREAEFDYIIEHIKTDHFDLAVLNISDAKTTQLTNELAAEFHVKTIYSAKLAVITCADHPLTQKSSVSLKTIIKYPIIMASKNNLDHFGLTEILQKYGKPKIAAIYSNLTLCMESICANQGVGFSFSESLNMVDSPVRKHLRVIPLKENISNNIVVVTLKSVAESSIVTAYVNYLTHFFRV